MTDLSRRTVLGATAGLFGAGLAHAQGTAGEDPHTIGTVEAGRVSLPPLHPDTEANARPPEPEAPARRLGVAVVGLGHLALEQILPAFGQARAVRLAALVSGHREKALAVAGQRGLPESALYDYAGFDRIKDNPAIDIVYVVVPNGLHEEFVLRAARAGKHVLCEKPMAASVAEAERMVQGCAEAKVKLMVAYRMQYEATQRATIGLARSGALGDLRLLQAVNGQNDLPGQWRQVKALSGGGSLPDVGLYALNAFRYITGEEPVEVTGRVTRPAGDARFREVEDVATFTLAFPSGVVGIGTSAYSVHETRSLQVIGSTGAVTLDNAFGYNNLTMTLARKAGAVEGRELRQYPPQNQFATEMDHFATAIRADAVPHTPGEEGLADMRLMAAIYEAAAGGSPVRLPRIAGLDTTRGMPLPAGNG